MFSFLTHDELLVTATILRKEVRLREEGFKTFRKTRPYEVASGHDYVEWAMKLAAVEEEIKKRGL